MAEKRKQVDEEDSVEEDDEWVGPMPSEAVQPKKMKGLLLRAICLGSIVTQMNENTNLLNVNDNMRFNHIQNNSGYHWGLN